MVFTAQSAEFVCEFCGERNHVRQKMAFGAASDHSSSSASAIARKNKRARTPAAFSFRANKREFLLQRYEFLSKHAWDRSAYFRRYAQAFVEAFMRQNSIKGVEDGIAIVEKIVRVVLQPEERVLYKASELEVEYALASSSGNADAEEQKFSVVELDSLGLLEGEDVVDGGDGADLADGELHLGGRGKAKAHVLQHTTSGAKEGLRRGYLSAADLKKRVALVRMCCHFQVSGSANNKISAKEQVAEVRSEKKKATEERKREMKKTLLKMLCYNRVLKFLRDYTGRTRNRSRAGMRAAAGSDSKAVSLQEASDILAEALQLKSSGAGGLGGLLGARLNPNKHSKETQAYQEFLTSAEDFWGTHDALDVLELISVAHGKNSMPTTHLLQRVLRRDLMERHLDRAAMAAEDELAQQLRLREREEAEKAEKNSSVAENQASAREQLQAAALGGEAVGGKQAGAASAAGVGAVGSPEVAQEPQGAVEDVDMGVSVDGEPAQGQGTNYASAASRPANAAAPTSATSASLRAFHKDFLGAVAAGSSREELVHQIESDLGVIFETDEFAAGFWLGDELKKLLRLAKARSEEEAVKERIKEIYGAGVIEYDENGRLKDPERPRKPIDERNLLDLEGEFDAVRRAGSKGGKKNAKQSGPVAAGRGGKKRNLDLLLDADEDDDDGGDYVSPAEAKQQRVDKWGELAQALTNEGYEQAVKYANGMKQLAELGSKLRSELRKKGEEIHNTTQAEFAFERLCQVSEGNLNYFRSAIAEQLEQMGGGADAIGNADGDGEVECPICMENFHPREMRLIERCSHWFCADCLSEQLKIKKECPSCRGPCPSMEKTANFDEVLRSYKTYEDAYGKGSYGTKKPAWAGDEAGASASSSSSTSNGKNTNTTGAGGFDPKQESAARQTAFLPWKDKMKGAVSWLEGESCNAAEALESSWLPKVQKQEQHGSKLHYLMSILHKIFEEDDTAKAIVFVQFADLRRRVEYALQSYKPDFRFTSTADPAGLKEFQDKLDGTAAAHGHPGRNNKNAMRVLILSLEKEASGLNLTSASHVFLLHPMCCATIDKACAFELQAMARVRRLGQTRPEVCMWRLVTADTVEQDVVVEHRDQIEARRKAKEDHAKKVAEMNQQVQAEELLQQVVPRGVQKHAAPAGGAAKEDENSEFRARARGEDADVGQMNLLGGDVDGDVEMRDAGESDDDADVDMREQAEEDGEMSAPQDNGSVHVIASDDEDRQAGDGGASAGSEAGSANDAEDADDNLGSDAMDDAAFENWLKKQAEREKRQKKRDAEKRRNNASSVLGGANRANEHNAGGASSSSSSSSSSGAAGSALAQARNGASSSSSSSKNGGKGLLADVRDRVFGAFGMGDSKELKALLDMGFARGLAVESLRLCGNDVQRAAERCLTSL